MLTIISCYSNIITLVHINTIEVVIRVITTIGKDFGIDNYCFIIIIVLEVDRSKDIAINFDIRYQFTTPCNFIDLPLIFIIGIELVICFTMLDLRDWDLGV